MDLYQVCSYEIPGIKTGLTPRGHKLEHWNKEAHFQNSSSLKMEGIELWYWYAASPCWPLPCLFIWCPWGQDWPRPGVTNLSIGTKKATFFFFEPGRSTALIFSMYHIVDLYQFYSYDTPGVKTGIIPGVTSWNNSNRDGRIHFVGKMTQVSDPGPSCLKKTFSGTVFELKLTRTVFMVLQRWKTSKGWCKYDLIPKWQPFYTIKTQKGKLYWEKKV